jgi:hypothetical protein
VRKTWAPRGHTPRIAPFSGEEHAARAARRTIYVRRDSVGQFDPNTDSGLAELGHEIEHGIQHDREVAFKVRYVLSRKFSDRMEDEADAKEDLIRRTLRNARESK